MAGQQVDELDDSILNQPWDPVSYFEDEIETEGEDGCDPLSTSQSKRLSDLFDDLNLKSVESDIKRVAIRRQQTEDTPELCLDETIKEEDGMEEPSSSIERFITYQDKEDHLKAVDNTVLINRKNIESDMKRFAHFKQHSFDQPSDLSESKVDQSAVARLPGQALQDELYIDELVKGLPDALQYEPFSADSSCKEEETTGEVPTPIIDELDIASLLPDPVCLDKDDLLAEKGDDADLEINKYKTDDQLLQIDLKCEGNDVSETRTFNEATSSTDKLGGFDSRSFKGSGESLNEIIEAAETIVKDHSQLLESHPECEKALKGREEDEKNNDEEMQNELECADNGTELCTLNASQTDKPDIAQTREHDTAPIDLLEGCRFEGSNSDQLNESSGSLRDELLSLSPTIDLHGPVLGADAVPMANLLGIEGEGKLGVLKDGPTREKASNIDKGKGKRKVKSRNQKYVVDIIKSEDSDSDADLKIERLSKSSMRDQTLQDSDREVAVKHDESQSSVSTIPAMCPIEDETGLETLAKVIDLPEEGESQGGEISGKNDEMVPLNEAAALESSEGSALSNEAILITEQLVDSILDGDEDTLSTLHSESQDTEGLDAASSNAVEADAVNDADATIELKDDANTVATVPEDSSSLVVGATAASAATRSGSTSDSEELEEFINQHLSDSASAAPATSAEPNGASLLPPLSDELQLGWYAPKWVPDQDAKGCMNCALRFTIVKRRHHCRACGKVLCSNCCNMKADLAYLSYKTSRVCQSCYEVLSKAQSLSPLPLMSGSQDVPGRGHTISLNDTEPGSSSFPLDSPPQYMPDSPPEYTVLPSSAVQSGPPNPPSYFASVRGSGFRSRAESDRSVVIMFNSSQTDLPPILRTENEVVKIINNPDLENLFKQLKDKEADPIAFLVNKNLVVKVRTITLDCCVGKECWCFSSDGMGASNQEEIVFLVEYKGNDPRLLKCVFQQFNLIFERAKHGEPLSDFGYLPVDEYMRNNPKNVGMILFKPNVQCVKNIMVPCHPYLFALWIQQSEVPWAKNLPLRLLVRLGAEFKSYPYPVYNVESREPVFDVVGRTIIALLADFRSFQYTLPKISGLLVSVTKKDTTIKLPQTRYDEVLKVLNTSEESVMAFCGNFNRKADSHLVCVETNGTHSTQTISCRTSSKKLTGCSFVVFSAALKSSTQNLQAKTSIVEDGIMVQVTSDTMKKIRTAMKEMQDLVTPASEAVEGSNEIHKLKIVWGSSDDSSTRTTSPIDGSSFDGLTNMRIRHSYDFTVSTSPAKIHWQEVYFLPNDADTVGRLSAKELSQMTSSVAKACMNALSPHLSTLVALEMTKIGLRMILDSDVVEYRIGANKEQLPQELTGDLDDKLIPVIHSVMKTVSHRRVSAELIFQITRVV